MSKLELSAPELRILGCLLEKQRTTPDGYPLSLNALRLACNQSTNRDPVVEYDEGLIREALHRLERRGLVRLASGAGSRASKYRHLLADALPLHAGEQALLCVLLLRGGQTPGELKQRTERIHAFASLDEVHAGLQAMIDRGLIVRHARRPGQKEDRYSQELGVVEEGEEDTNAAADAAGGVDATVHAADTHTGAAQADGLSPGEPLHELRALAERVARLEREVAELRGAG